MRYKVIFKSGSTLTITEARYINFLTNDTVEINRFLEGDWPYINAKEVDYVIEETSIETEGTVVKPPTPESVREAKKIEHDKKISSPTDIIEGVKEREKVNEI